MMNNQFEHFRKKHNLESQANRENEFISFANEYSMMEHKNASPVAGNSCFRNPRYYHFTGGNENTTSGNRNCQAMAIDTNEIDGMQTSYFLHNQERNKSMTNNSNDCTQMQVSFDGCTNFLQIMPDILHHYALPVKLDKTPAFENGLFAYNEKPTLLLARQLTRKAMQRLSLQRNDKQIAISTGFPVGENKYFVVLDIDSAKWPRLESLKTTKVKTGRGLHYYILTDQPINCGIYDAHKLIGHVKGKGSYVLCPPSAHKEKGHYYFVDTSMPAYVPLDELMRLIGGDSTMEESFHNAEIIYSKNLPAVLPELAQKILAGDTQVLSSYASRSEADFALIFSLLRQGFREEEIVQIYKNSTHDKHWKKEKYLKQDIIRAKRKLSRLTLNERKETKNLANAIAQLALNVKIMRQIFGRKFPSYSCVLMHIAFCVLKQNSISFHMSLNSIEMFRGVTNKTSQRIISDLLQRNFLKLEKAHTAFSSRKFALGDYLITLALNNQRTGRSIDARIFSAAFNQSRKYSGIRIALLLFAMNISPLIAKGFSLAKASRELGIPSSWTYSVYRKARKLGFTATFSVDTMLNSIHHDDIPERIRGIANRIIHSRLKLNVFRSRIANIALLQKETNGKCLIGMPTPYGGQLISVSVPTNTLFTENRNYTNTNSSTKACDVVIGKREHTPIIHYCRFLLYMFLTSRTRNSGTRIILIRRT